IEPLSHRVIESLRKAMTQRDPPSITQWPDDSMTHFPLILAFGFITPAFALAGLLLASIPIIIHILNRRRYKTVPWAAMEFLLRAMKKNRRRLKFERWLRLATR